MPTLRKILKLGTNGGPSANSKEPQLGNESGFYTSEQKRRPFTKEGWTSENESYRFPIDESPKDPWERCFEVVDRADEELYKELKDEISWLLIVASLFLGIVTAFSTMSFGWIRVDDRKVSTALLGDIVKLLNDTDARGTVPPRDATNLNFHPRDSEIIVNQLWFLSMTLSLSAVVVGTLCLQWLSTFRRKELKQRPYDDALALRQLRFEGLMGWGVPHVPGFLLLAVQGAFVLFAIGLMFLLWSVNRQVAIPAVIVGGVVALFLTTTAVMPLLQSVAGWIFPSTLSIPQCPYKSPVSWVIHRGCVLLSIIVTFPLSLLPRFGKVLTWRGKQIELLTDYTWQVFDDLWRKQRECWGPQTSKTGSKYSYYLVHGLASAMEILVFQPNAVHIIHTCLQGFHGTTAEEETFENLFGRGSAVGQEALSEYNAIKQIVGEKSRLDLSDLHHENLRRDFLNAHALQHFVTHNPKLHRALLHHRVELYIRVKNSSRHLRPLSKEGDPGADDSSSAMTQRIGTSIKCPIQTRRDAEALSPELRYQFLKHADWLLGTDRWSNLDLRGVDCVLKAVEKAQAVSGVDIDEPPLEETMKSVLKMAENHFRNKSYPRRHPRRQSTSGTITLNESGGEVDSPFDNEQGDRDPRSSGSEDADDKDLSPDILPSILMPLCNGVRSKLEAIRRGHLKGDDEPIKSKSLSDSSQV